MHQNDNSLEKGEERTLLEIFEESEERRKRNEQWSRLPPPNVEFYTRKPVVLLNWDDLDNALPEDIAANNSPSKSEELTLASAIDVDSTPDDDSFSNISQLTARLENVKRELEATGLQDKDVFNEFCELDSETEVAHSTSLLGEGKHIPPPPDFGDVAEDDDEYGIGSDMDLFEEEELDLLYDNVDKQLQQEAVPSADNSPDSSLVFVSCQSSGEVISLDDLSPIARVTQPSSPIATDERPGGRSRTRFAEEAASVRMDHHRGSSTPYNKASGSRIPGSVSGGGESSKTVNFTSGCSSFLDITTPQLSEAVSRARSYSSESNLSPDSDDLDLPQIVWGPSQTTPLTKVKDEPKAHCSKDILQAPPTSPPPPSSPPQPRTLVAKECPICNLSFPSR